MAGKKEIIMASALKLLEQHNYKELTVLDIVADSGVNRNTFYYHFKDMPALIEELACRSIDSIFDDRNSSYSEKCRHAVDNLYENRKIAMHVYGYAERAVFDRGLDKACTHFVTRIFECWPELQSRSAEEKKHIFKLCKGCVYGLACDWLISGLDEEGRKTLYAVNEFWENMLK